MHLLPGSSLSGTSTIQANVQSAGVTSPGDNGIGALTIDGNFSQYGDGTLNIQLGGTTAGTQYDQLAVTGAVQIERHDRHFIGQWIHASNRQPVLGHHLCLAIGRVFDVQRSELRDRSKPSRRIIVRADFTLVAATADIRVFPTTGSVHQRGGRLYELHGRAGHCSPTANVTLNLSSSNTSAGTVSPSHADFHDRRLERAPDGHGNRCQRQSIRQVLRTRSSSRRR